MGHKSVGEIRFEIDPSSSGSTTYHQYFPKGSSVGGEKFQSLNDCIKSLESA